MSVRVTRSKPFSLFKFAASIAGLALDKLDFFFHFRDYPNRLRNPSLFNSAASFAGLVLDKLNFFLSFSGLPKLFLTPLLLSYRLSFRYVLIT